MSAVSRVGFVGLGAMGRSMAKHVAGAKPTFVFDLAPSAVSAAESDGCIASDLETIAGTDMIVTSLPRSSDVAKVANSLIKTGNLREGSIWVDTTSGVPQTSKQIAEELQQHGVCFIDAGVAGGPAGAESGTLTAMVGTNSALKLAEAQDVMEEFCGKVVHIGPSGSGHAVKAVNNALLAAHIIVAYEGLLTLSKCGIQMDKALDAINAASGRSLVTEERIPNHVLSGKFDFGFEMGLMLKDIDTAMECSQALGVDSPVLGQVHAKFQEADQVLGTKSEHMEVLRLMEQQCGAEIRAPSVKPIDEKPEIRPPAEAPSSDDELRSGWEADLMPRMVSMMRMMTTKNVAGSRMMTTNTKTTAKSDE